ncbi:MAG TPA: CAP domain-containing protein [Xanthobacteraceae bacterium]|nr:CAP domain-containing protein [Xanthobacteraceae bacterium]
MFAAAVLWLGLAASAAPALPQDEFHLTAASKGAQLDAKGAAALITNFRRSHGLGPVRVDRELMRLAQQHARAMAARNELGHNVGARFEDRVRNSSIRARFVAENVAAGQRTLAEAFAAWRDSPGHRANMLAPEITRMGIGVAGARGSQYGVFWALILASPDERGIDKGNPVLWPFLIVPRP